MNAASLLTLPARPPHDPQVRRLGGAYPFAPVAFSRNVVPGACGGLELAPHEAAVRPLGEPGGSFGGNTLPGWLATDEAGGIWLLSRRTRVLRKFDPCTCRFVTVPCTGGGAQGARGLVRPQAVLVWKSLLLIIDRDPGRLLVFDDATLALRAIWHPAAGASWSPAAMTLSGAILHVADPASGAIHRFAASGTWRGSWDGLGAVDLLATGPQGLVHAATAGTEVAMVLDPQTGRAITGADAALLGAPPFTVAPDGRFTLGELCEGAGWFDDAGEPASPPPPPANLYQNAGRIVLGPIDSGIDDCVWHRLEAEAEVPHRAGLSFSGFTSGVELSEAEVAAQPPEAWQAVPWQAGSAEALFDCKPGRYLWLEARLSGDGQVSPRITSLLFESPRLSLGRYLPAAFAADAASSDFLDRMLALFDSQHRTVERQIDQMARLFDPRSAPSGTGNDVLGWLAGWLGLAYERRWSETRRRAMVAAAGPAIASRGTPQGLHQMLLVWLGWNSDRFTPTPPACGPRCAPAPRQPVAPVIVLEHWKLRRWLWLGKGRVGSDAYLWGESILKRSRLGDTARTGVTRLDATGNPLADPLAEAANRVSIFLPARCLEVPGEAAALARVVEDQRPAHVSIRTVPVHARMRIGVQAMIGLDAVVGCWPSATPLGRESADGPVVGRTALVAGRYPRRPPQRIGHSSILTEQSGPRRSAQGKPSA